MKSDIITALQDGQQALNLLLSDDKTIGNIVSAAQLLIDTSKSGNIIYSCGNGGSMSDAMHFVEECVGNFRKRRSPIGAAVLANDAPYLTCVGNDFGFEEIFGRSLTALGKEGDCILAISTSGNSKNIIHALEVAKAKKIKSIALVGRRNSLVGDIADLEICTPAGVYSDRVQELHIKVIHILIELIERELFPSNYSL
jgi:D-sedoheptulose 7-phosphate isomerase